MCQNYDAIDKILLGRSLRPADSVGIIWQAKRLASHGKRRTQEMRFHDFQFLNIVCDKASYEHWGSNQTNYNANHAYSNQINNNYNNNNNNNSNNYVGLARERTTPNERPPPVGEVSANVCGYTVSRGQRGGSLTFVTLGL
jgi:hypothetical protein